MPETRASKTAYLAARKQDIVEREGCHKCGRGKAVFSENGFSKFWLDDTVSYDARRFVFKYTDSRGSDVPVAKLPRMKKTTKKTIDDALARCVILCRSCADPRRTRKEMTQCPQTSTTNTSQPDS